MTSLQDFLQSQLKHTAYLLLCKWHVMTWFVFQDDVTQRLPAEQAIPQIAAPGQVAADDSWVHCAQLTAGRLDAALAIRTAAPRHRLLNSY